MSRTADIAALFSLKRISGQIAALILVSLVLIHVLIAGYFLLSRPKLLTDRPVEQFELIAQIIANTPQGNRALVLDSISRTFPALKLRLREGISAATAPPSQRTPLAVPPALEGRTDLIRGPAPDGDRLWFYLTKSDVLEATIGSPTMPAFVSGLWTSTLLFLVASVTLLGVWAGRALSTPLSAFARAAESFSLSGSTAPLPENGPEEIRLTARALNRMRQRISTLMSDRTRMLAAISHDLRTPITRLRLRSEYIEDQHQRVQTVRDLDQMQSMLESVLSFLRNDRKLEEMTLVDIASTLHLVTDQFADMGHKVSYEGPQHAMATARPADLHRSITNLVDNAVRFGGEVTVRLDVEPERLVIDIEDDGPGISEAHKASVLEPFVRGDQARNMDEAEGFGLGLSIANAIVLAHGGTLSLHDRKPHGLVVRIELPARQQQLQQPQKSAA